MIEKVRKRYATLKWVMLLLLFVVLLLVGTSRYLSSKFKPVAKTQLKELVIEATNGLYSVEFSDIYVNLLTGRSELTDVKIIPDSNVFRKLISKKKAPNNIYFISLKKLGIKNFHPWRLLRQKKLKVDELHFDNPDVIMVNKQFAFNEGRAQGKDETPYHYISKYLRELRVGTVSFKNIRFKYVNNNRQVPEVDSIRNLDITLKDWLIDSSSANDRSRLYSLKDVIIGLNDYTYATPDSMYHINMNQLNFRGATGRLDIKSLRVLPRYNEMEFGEVAGFARDRFHIEMSDLSLEGIDLPLYVRRQELYAKEMNIANGFIQVFNNNMLKKKGVLRVGSYPHQLLQKVRGQLTVKQLNLNNVDISYAEYDKSSRQKGIITFERTSGTVTNITNATNVKRRNPYMFANLTSYLMGKGRLDVKFRFDLLAGDGAFAYSGGLGSMDGKALNRITKPLGMVEVRRGTVKRMEFDVRANDQVANGQMKFAYNGLSVSLLKKEQGKEELVKKGFMSFLANALVINPDNPNPAGVLINAPIHYKRIMTASFFSFVWRSLFQGIKYSVGVTPQKEQRIRSQIAKFEQMKTDREKRRAKRQRRQEQKRPNR
jgi:hypothetical protein